MSFRDSFFQVKGLFEERLHDMGLVDADADSMGWTSMLSIEQDTQLSISVPSELSYGSASQITGILETEHFRRLTGKTVKLKVDNNIVASTITDVNGEYSFNYTPNSIGSLSFQVVFDASGSYTACFSNSVNAEVVVVVDSIEVSADKNILSYVDGDKATLYAQLKDSNDQDVARSGISITFNWCESDGSVIEILGTATTDATGKATLTDAYSSQGLGDIYFYATDGILQSETFTICDASFYDDQSSNKISNYIVKNNCSPTYVANEYIALGSGTEFRGLAPLQLNTGDNWHIEQEIMQTNKATRKMIGFLMEQSDNTSNYWTFLTYATSIGSYRYGVDSGAALPSNSVSTDINTWIKVVWKCINGNLTYEVYTNGQLIYDYTLALPVSYQNKAVKIYSVAYDSDAVCRFKNMLVKPIPSISVDVDNAVLSFADSTQVNPQVATLTATVSPVAQGRTVKIYQDDTLVATKTTDSQGQVSYEYTSQGVGDVEFTFESGAISETTTIEDCYLLVATCNRTGFVYNSSPFPVSAPVEISGLIKKDGSWGGTRIYGSSVNYVFLSNNSSNSNEGEKIRYNLSSTEVAFKVVLDDTSCQLYINDVLINSANADTSDGTNIWGGSGSNPVTLTNLKVKAL